MFVEGVKIGFWLWLGLVVPVLLAGVFWKGESGKLYLLNVAQYLVVIGLMAGLLAVWR